MRFIIRVECYHFHFTRSNHAKGAPATNEDAGNEDGKDRVMSNEKFQVIYDADGALPSSVPIYANDGEEQNKNKGGHTPSSGEIGEVDGATNQINSIENGDECAHLSPDEGEVLARCTPKEEPVLVTCTQKDQVVEDEFQMDQPL